MSEHICYWNACRACENAKHEGLERERDRYKKGLEEIAAADITKVTVTVMAKTAAYYLS